MNTLLEKLFEIHELSLKDRFEIRQIFNLLPEDKKRKVLNDFANLVFKIKSIQEDMRAEQEILIGDAVSNIRDSIELAKRQTLK
ncbi:MAG: hypothetical protein PHH06_01640 [Candidatus Gracilibacteria bacterium]|nr:hypothetical protein [Candidatus Gracilibacteria bacterium]